MFAKVSDALSAPADSSRLTKTLSLRSLAAILLSLLFAVGLAQAQTADSDAGPVAGASPEAEAGQASNGDFRYSVPFRTPAFFGIQPNLGLSYSSSSKRSGGGAFDVLSVGWRLSGFSEIRRTSARGGAPFFDNALDEYRLDGAEMVQCAAGSNAASCIAGGHSPSYYSTLVENWKKVQRFTSTNTWVVTSKSGVKYTYRPVSTWSSSTLTTAAELRLGNLSRWLLATISDPHGNTVDYSYHIALPGNGLAARPDTISYSDGVNPAYSIKFHYIKRENAQGATFEITSFAGGGVGGALSKQLYVLSAVSMQYGTSKIRAYKLNHHRQSVGRVSKLTKVTEYGNDYGITAGEVSSGYTLPSTTFTYDGENPVHERKLAAGHRLFETALVGDYDGDGADEVLQPKVQFGKWRGDSTYASAYDWFVNLQAKRYDVSVGNAISAATIPESKFAELHVRNLTDLENGGGTRIERDLISIRGGREPKILVDEKRESCPFAPQGCAISRSSEVKLHQYPDQSGNAALVASVDTGPNPTEGRILADLDGDGVEEVLVLKNRDGGPFGLLKRVERIDANTEQFKNLPWPVPSWSQHKIYRVGDFNADGKIDALSIAGSTPHLLLSNGAGFVSVPINTMFEVHESALNPQTASDWTVHTGDVNGDGATDLVFVSDIKDDTDGVQVQLATGMGFTGPQSWGSHNVNNATGNHVLADVNGDGRDDLIVQAKAPNVSDAERDHSYQGDAQVFISRGNRFALLSPEQGDSAIYVERFFGTGDFNGDGLADFLSASRLNPVISDDVQSGVKANGGFVLSKSQPPHLLQEVGLPEGGAIKVEYSPSTAWANERLPEVVYAASSITQDDGWYNPEVVTTVTYAGGAYDWDYRKFLGFKEVTERQPVIPGTGGDRIVHATYIQDLAARGALESLTVSSSTLGDFFKRELDWDLEGGPSRFVGLKVGEKQHFTQSTNTRTKNTTQTYDEYGNLTVLEEHGDLASAADQRATYFSYAKNPSKYIVDRLASRAVRVGLEPNGLKLSEENFYYDGSASLGSVSGKGELRSRKIWTGTGGNFVETASYVYNAQGNVIQERDAIGSLTVNTFSGAYLTSTKGPEGYQADTQWNRVCQLPYKETAPSGGVTITSYDKVCRTSVVKSPEGQGTHYGYYGWGNPNGQFVQTKNYNLSNPSEYVFTRERFDGLGRTVQMVKTGAASGPFAGSKASDMRYNKRGLLERQSEPRFATDYNLRWTWFEYDAANRETARRLPDGSIPRTYHKVGGAFQYIDTLDELGRRTRTHFDGLERLRWIQRWNGSIAYTQSRGYDLLGRLRTVADEGDGAGNRSIWRYTYDARGRRTVVDDPDLGRWTFTYDNRDLLLEQRDEEDQVTRFAYNNAGQITSKTIDANSPSSEATTYTYGPAATRNANTGQLIKSSEAGNEILEGYDLEGRRIRREWKLAGVTPPSFVETVGYDYAGRVNAKSYPNGITLGTSGAPWRYDGGGRLESIPGAISSIGYDPRDQVAEAIYANGVTDARTYHRDRGWLMSADVKSATYYSAIPACGSACIQSTQINPKIADRVTQVAAEASDTANQANLTNQRTSKRNLLTAINTLSFAYADLSDADAEVARLNGLLADEQDYLATKQQRVATLTNNIQDIAGQLTYWRGRLAIRTTELAAKNTDHTNKQNQLDNLYSQRQALWDVRAPMIAGKQADVDAKAHWVSEKARHQGKINEHKAKRTQHQNELNQQLDTLTDTRRNQLITWIANLNGWIDNLETKVDDADAKISTYSSKISTWNSQISANTNAIGAKNTAIPIKEQEVSDAAAAIPVVENHINNVTNTISNLEDTDEAKRDLRRLRRADVTASEGRITALNADIAAAQSGVASEQLDVTTAENAVTAAGGTVTNLASQQTTLSNAISTLTGQINAAAAAALAHRNAIDAIDAAILLLEAERDRVAVIENTRDQDPAFRVLHQIYDRDANGRIANIDSLLVNHKWTYQYDYKDQLLSAGSLGSAQSVSFAYLPNGNMSSGPEGAYIYPLPGQPQPHTPKQVGTDLLSYDDNGNMIAGLSGTMITYDAENRPLTVDKAAVTTTMDYAPDGTRLKKTSSGGTTLYLGSEIEILPDNTMIVHPHPNVRITRAPNGTITKSWLHRDHLGSVRGITDTSGNIAKRKGYYPYGGFEGLEENFSGTAPESKGYIGERYDPETGLMYLNARYYSPVLRRFISPDWWEVTEPGVGTNRYAYSMNNPINFADPSGHVAIVDDIAITVTATVVAVGIVAVDLADNGRVDGSVFGDPIGQAIDAIDGFFSSNDSASPNDAGVQPDGSFNTPGGNVVRGHGKKGNGETYLGGKKMSPEQVDDILANPAESYDTKNGDTSTGGRVGATTHVGEDGNHVTVEHEHGQVIGVSDTDHPERGMPTPKGENETSSGED